MFENINPVVFCIPFIAGFIGWITNWLAVKATLYPVKFIGIPPYFGWQGVMPKNAEEMSLNFSKMIREQLLDIEKMFADIKNDSEEIDRMVDKVTEKVIEEFSTNIAPDAWERSREKLRDYITNLIRNNTREMMNDIMDKMAEEAEDIIDIDKIMCDAMLDDRGLMGHVLLETARPEFRFIELSGLYFGFLFGVFQMIAWIYYPVNWVLPAAGFLVGYITNWMALTLIFEPAEPIKIGPFSLQGMFIKRQAEVAGHFSDVICDKVLNADNMMNFLKQEPARSKIQGIMEKQIDINMDVFEKDPMVGMLVTPEKLKEARADLDKRIQDNDFSNDGPMKEFAGKTSLIRDQMQDSLGDLDSAEFNGVLRPVFQKDEWKLMLVGGVLGIVIGVLQVVFIFGGTF